MWDADLLGAHFFFLSIYYNHHSSNFNDYMKAWGLFDTGFSYDVVAVFGSQSTGKSEDQIGHVDSLSSGLTPELL
jgi:hypothetical protein